MEKSAPPGAPRLSSKVRVPYPQAVPRESLFRQGVRGRTIRNGVVAGRSWFGRQLRPLTPGCADSTVDSCFFVTFSRRAARYEVLKPLGIVLAMTIEQVTALTELERDALGEVANIAMARAANSIRQMVGHQVLLSVPSVEILSKEAAAQIVGTPDNRILVAIRQDFTGAFSGRALLIFPETSSLELMRAVVGRSLSLKDIIDFQDEALAEIGNVILNSWVATIANLLKRNLPMSLPVVVRGDGRRVFEVEESPTTFVLFLRIRFAINHFQMQGYVALLMEIPSIVELRSLVADFVITVTQARDEKNRGGM
jgi:chemotaxis protein CheC